MSIIKTRGNLVEYQDKDVVILAKEGLIEESLQQFHKEYKGKIELARFLKMESDREFLAGVAFNPFVDVTTVRGYNGSSSIMTSSRDYDKSLEVIDELADATAMKIITPSNDLASSVINSANVEQMSAKIAEMLSLKLDIPKTGMWDAMHYINFLKSYCGNSTEESVRKASETFNLGDLTNIGF